MWNKIKEKLRSFMVGRHGADQLGIALLIGGLVLSILGSIFSGISSAVTKIIGFILSTAGFAAYIFCIFRMFSRNNEKRWEENRRYLTFKDQKIKAVKQAWTRFKNRKTYKYFRCPGCKAWLRLPRGKGVVTITCSRCHTSFTQKS